VCVRGEERERCWEGGIMMATEGGATSNGAESVEEVTMAVKWAGKEYTVRVCADDTVGELKRRICEVTNVLPKRQKLLNVKAGVKPAEDSMLLSQLSLKPTIKIMMMGCVPIPPLIPACLRILGVVEASQLGL
jgi:hypothetical protein